MSQDQGSDMAKSDPDGKLNSSNPPNNPSKAPELQEQIANICNRQYDKQITIAEAIKQLEYLLTQEITKARIDEIENFNGNDAHMYVRKRLAELSNEEQR